MTTRSNLLTTAAIIGAFVVGRMFADEPAPAPIASNASQAPPTTGISAAEIRHVVRAELQRERPTTVITQEAVVEEAPSSVLEQREKALIRARALVSSAVSARKWTRADARALLDVMAQLGSEEHDEILSSLIRPVNAGHIKLETNGSLLDPS